MNYQKFSVEDENGNISSMYTDANLINLAVELIKENPDDDAINKIIGYKNNLDKLIRNDKGTVMKDEIILNYLKDKIKNKVKMGNNKMIEIEKIISDLRNDHTYTGEIQVCYQKGDFKFPGWLRYRTNYKDLDDIQKAAVNVYNNRSIINMYFPNAIMNPVYIRNSEVVKVKVKDFNYANFGKDYEFKISIDGEDDYEYEQALHKVMGYLAKQMNNVSDSSIKSILSDENSVNVVKKIQNMNNNYKNHEGSLNQIWSNTVGDNSKIRKENKKIDKYIVYTVGELKRIFVDLNTVGEHKKKFILDDLFIKMIFLFLLNNFFRIINVEKL